MSLQFPKLTILTVGLLLNAVLSSPGLSTERPSATLSQRSTVTSPGVFEPTPGHGQPRRTTAGGSRNPGHCPSDRPDSGQSLVVIAPTEATADAAQTVQIQIPETSARSAEFSIFDESGKGIYQTLLALDSDSRMISITLSETSPEVQPNNRYRWVFSLVCQPEDRLQDRSISGWFRPAPTSPVPNRMTQNLSE